MTTSGNQRPAKGLIEFLLTGAPASSMRAYEGILAEPLPPLKQQPANFGFMTFSDDEPERKQAWAERVAALYAHFEIDATAPGADFALAMALALEHVPGFSTAPQKVERRGADLKWDEARLRQLVQDVDFFVNDNRYRLKQASAFRTLAKSDVPALRERYGSLNAMTLRRRYMQAKKLRKRPIGLLARIALSGTDAERHSDQEFTDGSTLADIVLATLSPNGADEKTE